jgi:hypothetical protein
VIKRSFKMPSLFDEIFCSMSGYKKEELEIANEVAKEFFGINFLVDLKKDEENDREKRKTRD